MTGHDHGWLRCSALGRMLGHAGAALACVLAIVCGLEPRAYACLSDVNCSGTTPICGLSLACRACENDLECGAPLSGNVCATSGAPQGACVSGGPVSDASTASCATDADCGA